VEDRRTQAARTHFDRWSETYENDPVSRWLHEVQTAGLAALGLNADDVLLDLACGTGAAVRAASREVRRAVGFDVSPGMIAQARERADGLPNVDFHEGDVSGRLPFATGEFTALLCTSAFHHFPAPRETIGEISRVLGPGGRVVIADGNRRHPAVFAFDLVLRVTQRSHVGLRSPARLLHDLTAAGFTSASYCTTWWRSFAFVRAEKPPRPAPA
jgi:ubiquinone/menaquinone biosynthesis C-methylase UbiE